MAIEHEIQKDDDSRRDWQKHNNLARDTADLKARLAKAETHIAELRRRVPPAGGNGDSDPRYR